MTYKNLSSPGKQRFSNTVPPTLSYEDFFVLYCMADQKGDVKTLSELEEHYPSFFRKAYLDRLPFEADPDDKNVLYPILTLPFYYDSSIRDLLLYLLDFDLAGVKVCMSYLHKHIKWERRRNVRTDESSYVFDANALWPDFFLAIPLLVSCIRRKRIHSLEELIFRAQEYFEQADPSVFPFD